VSFASDIRLEVWRQHAAEHGWRFCKLTARWQGALPSLLDIVAAPNGRFAYRIIDIDVVAMPGAGVTRAIFHVVRMPVAEIEQITADPAQAGTRVHEWRWNPRTPKDRSR
jgi:hypothetical protein